MNCHDVETWAEAFWRRAGQKESFPRSLERPVSRALPLAIVKIPRLWLDEVQRWLVEREIWFECQSTDRPLRACLLARAGHGLVFIAGSDPDDERRLSLAHEVAHFIRDYLHPRHRAIEALGEQILPVLDGLRAPSINEQIDGLLRGVTLGAYRHLIERSAAGSVTRMAVLEAEDGADRLALELLAPRRVVLNKLLSLDIRWREPGAFLIAEKLLVEEFGLPSPAAMSYSRLLVMGHRRPRSFREWFAPDLGFEVRRLGGKKKTNGR